MYAKEIRCLSRQDPVIGRLIKQKGQWKLKLETDCWKALCEAIVSQQLSTKVADVIFKRFKKLGGKHGLPTPRQVVKWKAERLRAIGLSWQKISYFKDLANRINTSQLIMEDLPKLSNEDVIKELVKVKGIGRWTAEMFLIFVLGRLDVLPADDLGLQRAIKKVYGLRRWPSPKKVLELGKQWKPYETIASWYLWKAADQK
ncbi:MAG: DNA-3-methyladenine glycosylase 2 family protein [bacterium]